MAMREDDRFVDFKAFKAAIPQRAHQIQHAVSKSALSRNIFVCARAGCPFRVYVVLSGNKKYVSVATVVDEHNCVGELPMLWHCIIESLPAIRAHKAKKTDFGDGLQQQGN